MVREASKTLCEIFSFAGILFRLRRIAKGNEIYLRGWKPRRAFWLLVKNTNNGVKV
jgi:hypothetical protein